jgi:hypothetical protein
MNFMTRRHALSLLGAATFASAQSFPKGAIIRTVLRDFPPEALSGGATLFHAGAKEEMLHQILVDNPRRFLAFVPKRPRKA